MARARRLVTVIAAAGLLILFFTYLHSSPLQTASSAASPLVAPDRVEAKPTSSSVLATTSAPLPAEKRLIIASLKDDDTSWIGRRLPGWSVTRYVVDDPEATYTVPINKGREAMVYLTYLIDNYDRLPEIMVFIHSLQFQWHNDDSNKDGATVLSRLQIPYVIEQGYVSLRCAWAMGCPTEIRVNEHKYDFPEGFTFRDGFADLFPERAAKGDIPEIIGAHCCSQFALTAKKAKEVPRREYQRWRQWLIDTPQDDAVSGRVTEYSWHILWGKPDINCPAARSCYCKLFGLCDLGHCTDGQCDGQYVLPQYSSKPEDWEPLPEFEPKLSLDHAAIMAQTES